MQKKYLVEGSEILIPTYRRMDTTQQQWNPMLGSSCSFLSMKSLHCVQCHMNVVSTWLWNTITPTSLLIRDQRRWSKIEKIGVSFIASQRVRDRKGLSVKLVHKSVIILITLSNSIMRWVIMKDDDAVHEERNATWASSAVKELELDLLSSGTQHNNLLPLIKNDGKKWKSFQ